MANLVGKITAASKAGCVVLCVGRKYGFLPANPETKPLRKDDYVLVSLDALRSSYGRNVLKLEGAATRQAYESQLRQFLGAKDVAREASL